jgi:hypothetical protein
MQTWIHRYFAPVKRLPPWISNPIRSVVTAVFTPFFHYYQAGHFRSSFLLRAVDRFGDPLPWYTYPSIDFLSRRSFSGRRVLEFGAGQSTLWWATRAGSVIAIDADKRWFEKIKCAAPLNVAVYFAHSPDAETCITHVRKILDEAEPKRFDIVVIDGLYRAELVDVAIGVLEENGAIICDNSDGYGIFEAFCDKELFQRVDFHGAVPGVVLRGCTSVFFKNGCFLFDRSIRVITR